MLACLMKVLATPDRTAIPSNTSNKFRNVSAYATRYEDNVGLSDIAFIVVMNAMSDSPTLSSYRVAYAETFRNLFEVLLGIAVLSGVASTFIKHASMDRVLDSEHVFNEQEERSDP